MKKEAADELARVETHHLALVAVSVVAPSEANMLAIEVDESMIGDGGLVSVAPEVGDYIGCPGKRSFGVDDPVIRLQRGLQRLERAGVVEATGDLWTLESTRSQRRYARRLKLNPNGFRTMRTHPTVRWEGQVADWVERAQRNERRRIASDVAGISRKVMETHFPELLINGRYVISMTAVYDPGRTYRLANWAIARELERLDEQTHWPRNAEELAAWLADKEGQILSRWVNGKRQDDVAGIVYDAKAEAIWILGRDGVVRDVATLTRDEDGTHFTYEKRGRVEYFDIWRLTRQYLPWTPIEGTTTTGQRHGAFLLTDHLVNTSTPVELWSDGNPWQVTFGPAGAVHADTDRGPLTGQWRLQGNFVAVELEDGRRHAWRWLNVAHAAGFEMPSETINPWKVPQRFTEIKPAIMEKPKTASALALEKTMERIRRKTEMYRQRIKAAEAREQTREAAERLQSNHEGR